MEYQIKANGQIEKLTFMKEAVLFRQDEYGGPAWQIRLGQELRTSQNASQRDGWHQEQFFGIRLRHRIFERHGSLFIEAEAENFSTQRMALDQLGLRLGLDCEMISYPQWDTVFFPTLLRCEKTYFQGLLKSPDQRRIAVFCPQPVAGWHLDYNRFFADGGHRVYTFCLDFMQSGKLPPRHPQSLPLEPKEKRSWTIELRELSETERFEDFLAARGVPVFVSELWSGELNTQPNILIYSDTCPEITVRGQKITPELQSDGIYSVQLNSDQPEEIYLTAKNEKHQSEACFQFIAPWAEIMESAARQVLKKPQKMGTHCESWYGLFTGALAIVHQLNFDAAAYYQKLRELIPLGFDVKRGCPIVHPGRIQNTACMIGLMADVTAASGSEDALRLGADLADWLIENHQREDGAFCNGKGRHYTSVIYIAKSILELVQEERRHPGDVWQKRAQFHFDAARRAIDELERKRDNIETEGQSTLEDGMLSCTVAQLAMLARMVEENERGPYIEAAEALALKHRCLERNGIPDGRCSSTTLRFWEAQYDVLTMGNMINSPHGWSAWKVYGMIDLYLLTGKREYLLDGMNTLMSCVSLLDLKHDELYWAFVPDAHVEVMRFTENQDVPGTGAFHAETIAEERVPMISGWYRAPKDTAVFGYIGDWPDVTSDQGGCCDNDVHEIFKCLEEVILTRGYVHEEKGCLDCFHCHAEWIGPVLHVIPDEERVDSVHVQLSQSAAVEVHYEQKAVSGYLRAGWLTKTDCPAKQ